MADKKKKEVFEIEETPLPIESMADVYHYREHPVGKPTRSRETIAYSVKCKNADKLERMAYHSRMSKSLALDKILDKFFKGKDFPPIPDDAEDPDWEEEV